MIPIFHNFVPRLDTELLECPLSHFGCSEVVVFADEHGHWNVNVREVNVWRVRLAVELFVKVLAVVILDEGVVG